MLILLSIYRAIQINFQMKQYDYQEPEMQFDNVTLEGNTSDLVGNIKLIKEDNRKSERTFNVSIVFGDPGAGIRAASSQHNASLLDDSDYIGSPESIVAFSPSEQEMAISFTLLPDDLFEGLEGFRITATPIFPVYDEPDTTFASTLIRILDNDCTYNVSIGLLDI